jgi:hypothetical protein
MNGWSVSRRVAGFVAAGAVITTTVVAAVYARGPVLAGAWPDETGSVQPERLRIPPP